MKNVDLGNKSLADLKYIAQLMGFADYDKLKKKELMDLISGSQNGSSAEFPASLIENNGNTEVQDPPKKRGRGRPPKKKISEEISKVSETPADKEIELTLPGTYQVNKESRTEFENTPPDLPQKDVITAAVPPAETVPVVRKRGRPPKNKNIAVPEVNKPLAQIIQEKVKSLEELPARANLPAESPVEGDLHETSVHELKEIVKEAEESVVETEKNLEDVKEIIQTVSETIENSAEGTGNIPSFSEPKENSTFVIKTGSNKGRKPKVIPKPEKQAAVQPSQKEAPVKEEPTNYDVLEGMLDILADGYGFLRSAGYMSGSKDVYVAPMIIKRYGLKTGDRIFGKCRMQKDNEKFPALFEVMKINGYDPETAMQRKPFETLTPIYPDEKFKLEISSKELSTRIIDLISPIGKGQRGIIVSPPKAGKTVLLKKIANSITTNYPDVELIVLLIDERPEEVTDMRESIKGDVVSSTFDEVPERHIKVAEMVIERAQRLVEHGRDVVILLDSMTRLARAYNLTIPPTGRTLSGGLDPGALHKPKRFFGSARNIRGGGSLTIVSTALVDTGSKMDEVIYEEFKGTGNMELHLDRKLSEKRIFPAIDINKSGTRKEELLLTPTELNSMWAIRKAMANLGTADVAEMIVTKLLQTKTNEDFIKTINTSFGSKS